MKFQIYFRHGGSDGRAGSILSPGGYQCGLEFTETLISMK